MSASFVQRFARAMHLFVLCSVICLALSASALSPHEILLLVNKGSESSIEIANQYIHLRDIPSENIVYVDLPEGVPSGAGGCSLAKFNASIYRPAQKAIEERDLNHVVAWVYSVDFPTRIKDVNGQTVSIMGATILGGALPENPEVIKRGIWRSPFYTGPYPPEMQISKAKSFFIFRDQQGGYRWPSFMLGYVGKGGNKAEEVISALERSSKADNSRPAGSIYFVQTEDVRSKCRAWQFPAAVNILKEQGVHAEILDQAPVGRKDVIGAMLGAAVVHVKKTGIIKPGAYTDHLTSFGAAFHVNQQTKISEWIRNGAAATAGTVVEPMAIWQKFPTAFMFAHYTGGATLMESLYQAVSCPLELLMLGDPLTRPWGRPAGIRIMPFEDVVTGKGARFALDYRGLDAHSTRVDLFLDGKWMGKGNGQWVELPTADLADGYHVVRIAAKSPGALPVTAYDETGFIINRMGRRIEFQDAVEKEWPFQERRTFTFDMKGSPVMTLIRRGETIIGVSPPDGTLTVTCSTAKLGKGPVSVQPEAVYEDGQRVRGEPVEFNVVAIKN